MYKETITKVVCKHHQWQQQGQHWNMSITIYLYKLIIPDLTKTPDMMTSVCIFLSQCEKHQQNQAVIDASLPANMA